MVKSEVEGRIVWVSPSFSNGGSIAAGQTLLRIDPAEFEFEVAVAQADVERAEARVGIEEKQGEVNARTFARTNPDAKPSAWLRRVPHIALARAELKRSQAELAYLEPAVGRSVACVQAGTGWCRHSTRVKV